MALWNEPDHQCAGCIYNKMTYGIECEGCRRRGNTAYGTEDEDPGYLECEDKYTAEVVVSYGSTKVLKRRSSM